MLRRALPLALLSLLLVLPGARAQQAGVERQLTETTTCYQNVMGLQHWKMLVLVYSDTSDHRRANTRWDLVHYQAQVRYNLAYLTGDGHPVYKTAVHELTHLLHAELFWYAAQHSAPAANLSGERAAESVADWPMWATLCQGEG